MNKLTKNEIIFISIVVIMGFVVLVSYLFMRNNSGQSGPIPQVTTPPVSSSDPIPDPSVTIPSSLPVINNESIEALKKRLPYTGEYFYLDFDTENNIFLYVYEKNFYQAAENELNVFLQQDRLSRDELENFGFDSYFY